jgi:phosphohistidine phosphatase
VKTLLLMRHAEAHLEQDSQTDFDRTLTPDGEKMATQTGVILRQLGIPIHRILASAAPRALHTAQLVATQASPAAPLIALPELYAVPADRLASAILRHSCPDEDSIMLVAHNPAISSLMYRWSGHDFSVPPATLLVLTANTDDWHQFTAAPLTASLLIRDAEPESLDNTTSSDT